MSDEPEAFAGSNDPVKPRRRPGRPKKLRHDPDPAPIDGDYVLDRIVNKEIGVDYALVSRRQRAPMQARGWTPERWGTDCARPQWDYNEHKDGDEVTVNGELTLMKMPASRHAQQVAAERKWHTDAKDQLRKAAENSGGKFKLHQGVVF